MKVPYCDQCEKKICDVVAGMLVVVPYQLTKLYGTIPLDFCSKKCLIAWLKAEQP